MIDTKRTTNGYAPPAVSIRTSVLGRSRMTYSRLIGALFLLGFLSYGIGSGLATSLVGSSNFLSTIGANQTLLITGAFLIFLNTGVDVGKAVLFFPILEKHSQRTALAYLATMIVEVVLLAVGALALLLIVPLGKHAGEPGAQTLGSILVQTNFTAYQMGEMVLGVGATLLCVLLSDPAHPTLAGDLGLNRLPDSRGRDDRGNLRHPHRPVSHDPRLLL